VALACRTSQHELFVFINLGRFGNGLRRRGRINLYRPVRQDAHFASAGLFRRPNGSGNIRLRDNGGAAGHGYLGLLCFIASATVFAVNLRRLNTFARLASSCCMNL
jgi:hypothetical protein